MKLAIDEWGLWNGAQGNRENLWGLEQTYKWQDALAVASWLNAMQRHASIVGIATWAQLANVIPPILGKGDGIPDILDEAMWGTMFWEYMQETNGAIHWGTERRAILLSRTTRATKLALALK